MLNQSEALVAILDVGQGQWQKLHVLQIAFYIVAGNELKFKLL
jgi:hypothetical protein